MEKGKDREILKLRIELATLKGEFIGSLKGFLFYDIDCMLKANIELIIDKLEKGNG